MPKVFRLAFLDFETPNYEADRAFYTEVMGLKITDAAARAATYLTLGYDHHNIALHSSDKSGLAAVGYQLNKNVLMDDMARELAAAGIGTTRKTDARPGVRELLEVEAIGGHVVQLFEQMEATAPGFSNHGVCPVRLGHFAVISPEKKLNEFYTQALGFHHTDAFGEVVHFYTCNHDHHVLNIVDAPAAHRLHHVAFQLREYAAHAPAADILASVDRPILWGPTRHTSGHNIASYFRDPDNRLVELYTDMDVYLPELDIMEPRPWHSRLPMRPHTWASGDLARWKTEFEFKLSKA